MTYKTLMANLALRQANTGLLSVTRELADRFEAKVIGLAACQSIIVTYADASLTNAYMPENEAAMDQLIETTQSEFQAAFNGSNAKIEWRAAKIYETVADYVSQQCSGADIVITGGIEAGSFSSENPGNIVMQAGRPVLMVPESVTKLKLKHAAIAWKNTREARRAIADALPFLKLAKHVTLLQIGHKDEHKRLVEELTEIATWLSTHHVSAEIKFVASGNHGDAYQLNSAVKEIGADLVVAGAYGHSRLREWAFGGVTRDLMLNSEYCTLLSH